MSVDDAVGGLEKNARFIALGSVPPPRVEAAPLREALRSVAAALRSFPDRGMILGDVAVVAHGVPRAPRNVEATLATPRELERLFVELEAHALVARIDDGIAFARARQILLLRHVATGVDVDLSLAWLPFELDALAAAEDVLLGTVELTIVSAEDLVLYKARTWRPQDQDDVERLLALHGKTMDLVRIRRVVAELAGTVEDSRRLGEVERVIERGLGLSG